MEVFVRASSTILSICFHWNTLANIQLTTSGRLKWLQSGLSRWSQSVQMNWSYKMSSKLWDFFPLKTCVFFLSIGWWEVRPSEGCSHSSSWKHPRSHPEHLWFVWGLCMEEWRTRNRHLGWPHEFYCKDPRARSKWLCRLEEPHLQKVGRQRRSTNSGVEQCRRQDEKSVGIWGSRHSKSFHKNDWSSRLVAPFSYGRLHTSLILQLRIAKNKSFQFSFKPNPNPGNFELTVNMFAVYSVRY